MTFSRLASFLPNLFRREREERELDEEVRSHELLLADETMKPNRRDLSICYANFRAKRR
jgi:hypothetical protein